MHYVKECPQNYRETSECVDVCNCHSCSVRGENLTLVVTEVLVQRETYAVFLS